jgi:hypothetical protein
MKNNFQVYHFFFACQVMGIVGSQIENLKKKISMVRVIVGL